MEELKVKYLYDDLPELKIPEIGTGINIYSNENIVVPHQEAKFVHTGLYLEVPYGWGIVLKNYSLIAPYCLITHSFILEGPECMIGLFCHTKKVEERTTNGYRWLDTSGFTVNRGDIIAQLAIVQVNNALFSLDKNGR